RRRHELHEQKSARQELDERGERQLGQHRDQEQDVSRVPLASQGEPPGNGAKIGQGFVVPAVHRASYAAHGTADSLRRRSSRSRDALPAGESTGGYVGAWLYTRPCERAIDDGARM